MARSGGPPGGVIQRPSNMNTTTATYRNILFQPQDFRLPAGMPGRLQPQTHDAPGHDFLVLNQHPDLTPEPLHLRPATAMAQEP